MLKKYNELNIFKVRCKIPADEGEITNRSSESGYDLLSDYDEELKPLFKSKEETDIKTIEDCLKSKYSYIDYIEPIN